MKSLLFYPRVDLFLGFYLKNLPTLWEVSFYFPIDKYPICINIIQEDHRRVNQGPVILKEDEIYQFWRISGIRERWYFLKIKVIIYLLLYLPIFRRM